MMEMPQTIRDRIERLSPERLSELSERLARNGDVQKLRGTGTTSLVAFVVLDNPGAQPPGIIAELLSFCEAALPRHERPSDIVALETLPRLPNGKIDRLALAALAPPKSDGPTDTGETAFKIGGIESRLAVIWQDVLKIPEVRLDDNFFELGGDSILSIQITSRLRQSGYDIDPTAILMHPTIGGLARALRSRNGDQERAASQPDGFDPLILLKPGDPQTPLFLLHTAGGDPIIFSELVRQYAASRQVFGVRSSAVSGWPALSDISEMADLYARKMASVVDRNAVLHLFSECGGGLLVLETAHKLSELGLNTGAMVILDPGWIYPERSDWSKDRLGAPGGRASRGRLHKLLLEKGRLRRIVAHVLAGLRQTRHLAKHNKFMRGLSAHHRRSVRSYMTATKRYVPSKSPRSIDLLYTTDRGPGKHAWAERVKRWQAVASKGVMLHRVPGSHDTVLTKHAQELGEVIEEILSSKERSLAVTSSDTYLGAVRSDTRIV